MSSFTLIIAGLITGLILGKAVSILHYAIKIKQEEEKYDRDREELWRLIWEKSRPHTVKVIYEDMEKYKEINSLLLR